MTETASADRAVAGKTIIVTGANSGIGKETAVELAAAGARVMMLCRDSNRGMAALTEVKQRSRGDVEMILADLAEPSSVAQFVDQFTRRYDSLDVLVNNAGVYLDSRRTNSRGWEMHWAINHLGPAFLTLLLHDHLVQSAPARVVNVSSIAHRFGVLNVSDPFYERRPYIPFRLYSDTKLANVLFTAAVNEKWGSHGVAAYALHPGMVATSLTTKNPGIFSFSARVTRPVLQSPRQGAQTQVWLASTPSVPESKGHYYAGSQPRTSSGSSRKAHNVRNLWDWTLRVLEIQESNS